MEKYQITKILQLLNNSESKQASIIITEFKSFLAVNKKTFWSFGHFFEEKLTEKQKAFIGKLLEKEIEVLKNLLFTYY